MASQIDPGLHRRIVHATLRLGDLELMGVDQLPEDYAKPQGFFVTLTVEGTARAKEFFDALSEEGEIRLAFQRTFWSARFRRAEGSVRRAMGDKQRRAHNWRAR